MSCKHIWWNLPTQIKEKLNITLASKWFKIPTEINNILRQLEQDKPTCYLQSFQPNYKVNWFTLLLDLEKVCNVIDCSEVSLTTFGISSFYSGQNGYIFNVCPPVIEPPVDTFAYHNGLSVYPTVGDTIYEDSNGVTVHRNGTFLFFNGVFNDVIIIKSGISKIVESLDCE